MTTEAIDYDYDTILEWATSSESVVDCLVADVYRMRASRSPRGQSQCFSIYVLCFNYSRRHDYRHDHEYLISFPLLQMTGYSTWANSLVERSEWSDGCQLFLTNRFIRMGWIRMSKWLLLVSVLEPCSYGAIVKDTSFVTD
jgi:hypothetical protein